MKKTIKTAMFVAAVAFAGFGTWKAYDYSEGQKKTLMAYNVEAQSQDLGDWVQNNIIQPVEDWWNSLVHDADPAEVTIRVKVGASVQIPSDAAQVEINGEVYYEWKINCNRCIDGNTYAHCWEIPNRCP